MRAKLITIVGPTASGKTGLGIEIAKRVGGEVISVDSRQVYREMNIGTAKVSRDLCKTAPFRLTGTPLPPHCPYLGRLGGWLPRSTKIHPFFRGLHTHVIPSEIESSRGISSIHDLFDRAVIVEGILHWGVDLIDPDTDYSVAEFKIYAERKIDEIVKHKHVPILVGGTGLWVAAIIDNFDLTSTPADPQLRTELESRPLGDLFAEYKRLDPDGAEVIDRENKRRVVRALEVTRVTERPFSQQQTRGEPKYDALQIGLMVDRAVLNERINHRVDEMIANGLVSEVRALKEKYGGEIDAMSGIGYRQICAFLDGKSSLIAAIEETKKATRQYAKRQMTWFKRDTRIHWVSNPELAHELVLGFLSKR